jgi:hypothetical protein
MLLMFALIYWMVKNVPTARSWWLRFIVDQQTLLDDGSSNSSSLGMDTDTIPSPKSSSMSGAHHQKASLSMTSFVKPISFQESLSNRFHYAIVLVAMYGYTYLASTAASPFNCTHQPDGTFTLRFAASVTCYTSEWWTAFPFAFGACIVYLLGIPLWFAYVAWRANKEGRLVTQDFIARYGALTVQYREQYWHWAAIEWTRQGFIIFIIHFIRGANLDFAQINLALVVMFIYLMIQVILH